MERLLQKFILYAKLPEMRLFWIFLPLIFGIFAVEVVYLPQTMLWFSAGFFVILAIVIFFNNLRLARSNLEIKIERNELTGIVAALRDGLIAYDPNFKILIFNSAAEKIFGFSKQQVVGKYFSPEKINEPLFKIFIQTLFPSLAPIVAKHSAVGEYPQVIDLSFDEPKMELRVITNKIIDSNGRLLGFVKVVSDRTRETELLRSKSEFLSVAAHQLRTPLTAVNWIFESLANESLNDNQRQMVDSGLTAGAYLLKIVNDLLDVSKIEEGRFGYNFKTIDLIGFIDEVLSRAKSLADEAGVKLYFQKPAESIEINIDKQKLGMALYNLIDNAVRYNVKNGEATIGVEKLKDKPYVKISVKDTGIGIPKESINNLFAKFFRAENAIKSVTSGSGLGLYIAKNIVKRHGGEIWAESELNRGSVFYFTLPIDPKLMPTKEIAYGDE